LHRGDFGLTAGKQTAYDTDVRVPADGKPPTYGAVWTAVYSYVRYADGEREYCDRAVDPY
jgi:hypothetical protein